MSEKKSKKKGGKSRTINSRRTLSEEREKEEGGKSRINVCNLWPQGKPLQTTGKRAERRMTITKAPKAKPKHPPDQQPSTLYTPPTFCFAPKHHGQFSGERKKEHKKNY